MANAMLDPALKALTAQIAEMQARITMLERNQRSAYNLGNSSIDGGSLPVNDANGQPAVVVGLQGDGTFGVAGVGNAVPVNPPDPPAVMPGIGSLMVTWDGLMAGGQPPMNFSVVQVHCSTVQNFVPGAATLAGSIPSAGLFMIGGLTPGTTYWVALAGVNQQGNNGPASTQVSGVPLSVAGGITPGSITAGMVNFTASAIGGPTVSIGPVAPPSPNLNDIWYNATAQYQMNQWNGTSWVPCQFGTGAIQAGSITAALIAANSITSGQIVAGGITAQAIAAATITGNLIAAGTISAANIAAGTITGGLIAANTITASLIAAGTVVAQIVDGTTITGATVIDTGGGYWGYNGTPALGNLFYSDVPVSGIDGPGNAYLAGITFYGSPSAGVWIAVNYGVTNAAFGPVYYTASSPGGPWSIDAWLRRSSSSAGQLEIGPILELLGTSLLPATPAGGAKFWVPSNTNTPRVMKLDGEPGYGIGETIYSIAADQTISTAWATGISAGGVNLSVPVASGQVYFFDGTFWVNLATSFAIDIGFTGPAVSACQWYYQGTTSPTMSPQTALSFVAPTPSAGDYVARCWGSFTPSASGTFSMAAGKVANNFTVKAGSYLKVRTHH